MTCEGKHTMACLYLIRSAPGGGKTQYAATFFSNIPHFENDMFFYNTDNHTYSYDRSKMSLAIEWCFNAVENCLKNGISVCVSNTFTKKRFVDSYRNLAEKYGASFKVYRMMGDFKNVHGVPEDVLKGMKENFEDYDGEEFVYPDLHNDRRYMLTTLKVGDGIEVNGVKATVSAIKQGAYDWLNVHYREDETGRECLCMTDECNKI